MRPVTALLLLVMTLSSQSALGRTLSLEECVDIVLERNSGLKSSQAESRSAAEEATIAQAALLPSLKLKSFFTLVDKSDRLLVDSNSFAPGVPPQKTSLSLGETNWYGVGVALRQPLFTGCIFRDQALAAAGRPGRPTGRGNDRDIRLVARAEPPLGLGLAKKPFISHHQHGPHRINRFGRCRPGVGHRWQPSVIAHDPNTIAEKTGGRHGVFPPYPMVGSRTARPSPPPARRWRTANPRGAALGPGGCWAAKPRGRYYQRHPIHRRDAGDHRDRGRG